MKHRRWTQEELEQLKIDYPRTSGVELQKKYNRTKVSIKSMAHILNIYKDKTKNKEEIQRKKQINKDKAKIYYEKNRERILQYHKNYRINNSEKVYATARKCILKKPEYYRNMHKKWWDNNKEEQAKKKKVWRINHKKEKREKSMKQYHEDKQHRLRVILRRRLLHAVNSYLKNGIINESKKYPMINFKSVVTKLAETKPLDFQSKNYEIDI